MKKPIDIHIDELVLHGLAGADGHSVAGDLQRELTQLLGDAPTDLSAAGDHLSASSIGVQIARSVLGGLKGKA